ncbi:MAG: hypothetical protein HFE73_00345 [Firmicutes bacterium]|nr:hypothetical protein [Bacillota bacterium]
MKKRMTRTLALVLSVLLITGTMGLTVYGMNSDGALQTKKSEEQPSGKVSKEETVYVMADAEGQVKKIMVSDWIENTQGSQTIADRSELEDVTVVKGEQTYTMNGEHMRVWDAAGNDIYYQGNIEKELPVDMTVSYRLDGKAISAKEIAGRSGRVTIRFDYVNNQYEKVLIDGKEEKIYVPFAMLTGALLDDDSFTNVEVSNGKLINDGSRIAVIGVAFPGLSSNLNLSSDKLEIPDYVEISADVKDFQMTNTVTIATSQMFEDMDTGELNSMADLEDSLGQLTEGMNQLLDGSSDLYDGLCTLLDKSEELVSGIRKLADGAAQLKSGAGELKKGAAALDDGAAQLSAGAKELAGGLGELHANSKKINDGSKQIFESLLATANSQLYAAGVYAPKLTIDNYVEELNKVIASLDVKNVAERAKIAAQSKVSQMVRAEKNTIKAGVIQAVNQEVTAKVTEAVRANVETQVLSTMGMTKEEYDAAVQGGMITEEQQNQIAAAIDSQMAGEVVQATIAANVSEQMKSADMEKLIEQKTEEQIKVLIEQNMNSAQVQGQITEALMKAQSGAASISSLKTQLDSFNTFYQGLNQYTAGVAAAKDGADQLQAGAEELHDGTSRLKTGASDLYDGMAELYDGILTLKKGAPALVDGVEKLHDGSMQLSDGLREFNEKGIKKLVEAVDGDLDIFIDRVKATVDAGKSYQSFSGLSDDMEGTVKFLYRTEAIDIDKEK